MSATDDDLEAMIVHLRDVLAGHRCAAAESLAALVRDGIAARVAAEREACARVAERWFCADAAAEIRARKDGAR